jgi:hypothetical protein
MHLTRAQGLAGPNRRSIMALATISFLILCSAIAVRWTFIDLHFSHPDDAGVAVTIFEARRDIAGIDDLRGVINNSKLRQYDSAKMRLLRRLDAMGTLAPVFGAVSVARDMLAVPLRWTYAPAQYFVTPWLISSAAPYRTTLAAGRTPSAVASILAVIMVGICAWIVRGSRHSPTWAVSASIVGLSLEYLVFSMHMSNYAAGTLAAAALFGIVASYRDSLHPWRAGFLLGIALSALIYVSYQVLFLIPGALAALMVSAMFRHHVLDRGRSFFERVRLMTQMPATRTMVAAFTVFVIVLVPTYLIFLSTIQPVTWNAGPHQEFIFDRHYGTSMVGFLQYAATFTIWNFLQIFAAMTSPVPESSSLYWPICGLLFLFFALGLFALLRPPAGGLRFASGLFIVFVIVTSFAAAWAGASALSPTRHALILLPLFAIAIGEGVSLAIERLAPAAVSSSVMASIFSAAIFVAWATQIPSELAKRRDQFDERAIAALIDNMGVRTAVEYDFTANLELMPQIRSRVALYNQQNLNFPWLEHRLPDTGPMLFASQGRPLSGDLLAAVLLDANRTLPDGKSWHFCFDENAIIYHDERPSTQTIEVSPKTDSGSNGYFIYVIDPTRARSTC